ncbi:MAG TPA: hypothetical protein VLC54_14780, partial [Anaeromyxobacter sp.]|nr:hypothetical protein [Anaeromyxobacter sp.]
GVGVEVGVEVVSGLVRVRFSSTRTVLAMAALLHPGQEAAMANPSSRPPPIHKRPNASADVTGEARRVG